MSDSKIATKLRATLTETGIDAETFLDELTELLEKDQRGALFMILSLIEKHWPGRFDEQRRALRWLFLRVRASEAQSVACEGLAKREVGN